MSKRYRSLVGSTNSLHFDESLQSTLCDHHRHQQPPEHHDHDDGDGDGRTNRSFPRRRLTMVISPSAMAKRGLVLGASIHQLQVGYRTAGRAVVDGGGRVRDGMVTAGRTSKRMAWTAMVRVGRTVRSAIGGIHRTWRGMVRGGLLLLLAAVRSLQGRLERAVVEEEENQPSSGKDNNHQRNNQKRNHHHPTTWSSSPSPVSNQRSTTSSPTWLSGKSNTGGTATTTTTTLSAVPGGKKSSTSSSSILLPGTDRTVRWWSDSDVPQLVGGPTLLGGGLFSKLLSGLLIVSGGALLGYYLGPDWRDDRARAQSHSFVAVIEEDGPVGSTVRSHVAAPITPEMRGRY